MFLYFSAMPILSKVETLLVKSNTLKCFPTIRPFNFITNANTKPLDLEKFCFKLNIYEFHFYHLFCCWNLFDIQYYVLFRSTTKWFDLCIHNEMIPIISLITIHPHAELLQYYLPYSLCWVFHLWGLFFFITGGLYFLIPFTYFAPSSLPPTHLSSVSLSPFLFICFYIIHIS